MNELCIRLASGDQTAFAELYDTCADRLHRYLAVRLRSPQDAEEVLQETFVRLARSRHRLGDVENPAAYVFTIARRESIRLSERRSRERKHCDSAAEGLLEVLAAKNDQEARELANLISTALERLEADSREVIELKTYGGLTFREIAEVTGLPQGTVATRYRTAIGRLRQWLAKELS